MSENKNAKTESDESLRAFFDEFEAALNVITMFEAEAVKAFHKEQIDKEEKELRDLVAKLPYLEGFQYRLRLLKKFANKNDGTDHPMRDKVDHLFPTILNGIRTAVDMNKEFEADPEKFNKMPLHLLEKFEKNRLTVLQGRMLIMETIKFVQKQGWKGIDDEPAIEGLKRIWDTRSEFYPKPERKSDVPGVLWTGGGELARESLDDFDPFDLLGIRDNRS